MRKASILTIIENSRQKKGPFLALRGAKYLQLSNCRELKEGFQRKIKEVLIIWVLLIVVIVQREGIYFAIWRGNNEEKMYLKDEKAN